MTILPTEISGLVLVEPRVFHDERGWFFEAFNEERYSAAGIPGPFVQDNVSWSTAGVLRGLHFQGPNPQGKLIQVLQGAIWDVAVDIRIGSPTFGAWEAYELSGENHRQFFIPEGFAHGFVVTSAPAMVAYKCTSLYFSPGDTTLRYDDPEVGIEWPITEGLMISEKDRKGFSLAELPRDRLVSFA